MPTHDFDGLEGDIHQAVASKVFSVKYDDVTPAMRQFVKERIFFMMYGNVVHNDFDEMISQFTRYVNKVKRNHMDAYKKAQVKS